MTWGQTLKLTFRGHQIHILTRLNERNTMAFLVFSVPHLDKKSYVMNIFLKNGIFY